MKPIITEGFCVLQKFKKLRRLFISLESCMSRMKKFLFQRIYKNTRRFRIVSKEWEITYQKHLEKLKALGSAKFKLRVESTGVPKMLMNARCSLLTIPCLLTVILGKI